MDVEMGGYSDFSMVAPCSVDAIAGICHARGMNADLPPQWLMCIIVEHLDNSVQACHGSGGKVVVELRSLAGGRFCVIQDPAGAVYALFA